MLGVWGGGRVDSFSAHRLSDREEWYSGAVPTEPICRQIGLRCVQLDLTR